MANKETAMQHGVMLMTILPELDGAKVTSAEPLGQDGYIFNMVAGSTDVTAVVYDDMPDTLFELDDIPRNEKGESPFHVLREFSTVDRMALRWPNAIRAIIANDTESMALFSNLPDWNGDPMEFVRSVIDGIRIIRLGTYGTRVDDDQPDMWECLALDTKENPVGDAIIRKPGSTAIDAIKATIVQIIRNRTQKAAIQTRLANMDDATLNA